MATTNPLDLIALDDAEMACEIPVQPVVVASSAIRALLARFFTFDE